MLAKEVKIANLKSQREFIKEMLERSASHPSPDGNTAFSYLGYLFPENIQYFQDEGYDVTLISSDTLLHLTKGLPVHLFTIRDDVTLTDDELEEAESIKVTSVYSYEDDGADDDDMDLFDPTRFQNFFN